MFLDLNVPAVEVIALYPAVISSHLPPQEVEVVSSPKSADLEAAEAKAKNTQPSIMSKWPPWPRQYSS